MKFVPSKSSIFLCYYVVGSSVTNPMRLADVANFLSQPMAVEHVNDPVVMFVARKETYQEACEVMARLARELPFTGIIHEIDSSKKLRRFQRTLL